MTIIDRLETQEKTPHSGKRPLIVAIDGPAGTGKSTVARLLASRLGCLYLDTGALYRAVAWKVRTTGVEPSDHAAISRLLSTLQIRMDRGMDGAQVIVDGRKLSQELRSSEISQMASIISAIPAVRDWLLPIQREAGVRSSLVAEGRDIGTRVFPQADVKFFLDAAVDVRAARRHQELPSGENVTLEQTKHNVQARDERDRSREIAPLVPAPDAHVIDTSVLTVEQVLDRMMAVIAVKL